MNWKQKLAEYHGYIIFDQLPACDQRTAEKAVELYQKELNEKLKNVGLSISELDEEKEPEKRKSDRIEYFKKPPEKRKWFGANKR